MRKEHIRRVVFFILLVVLAVILKFLTASPQIWGVICAMVFLPLLSLCANLYVRRHIHASFSVPPISAKYSDIQGRLRFVNDSILPAARIHCKIKITNDLTAEENEFSVVSGVGAKKEAEENFFISSRHCGRLHISIESVKISDWYGIFYVNAPVESRVMITVIPELFVSEVSVNHLSSMDDDGTADRKGDDRSEVFQLREYQPGDDIRLIHHKLSGKLDNTIIREGSQNISRSLMVFWDKRNMDNADNTDALAESVASVSQGILDGGNTFDLCWSDGEEYEIREIRDEDALLQSIPELVSRRGNDDGALPDFSGYGKVIYFSSMLPEGNTDEKIFYLVCTDYVKEDKNLLTFTSLSYKDTLQRPEI